jgi:tetratricopeptide (TPR) repeat protein
MTISHTAFRLVLAFCVLLALGCKPRTVSDEKPVPTSREQVELALADVERRIVDAPNDAALFAERASLQERRDSLHLAVNDWKRAITLDPRNAHHHIELADLYYRTLQVAKVEEHLREAMRLAPDESEPRSKLAELKLLQREYQEAMDLVNEALRLDPNHAKGYFLKGWIYKETGDTLTAISSYRTATEQDPMYFDPFLHLGVLHAERREPLAMQYFNSALQLRPNSVEALYGLGMYGQENGMDSLALACYDRIKQVEPNNALPWYNTGFILLEHRKLPAEAREQFAMAIQLLPTYAEAYYNRGLTYELEGTLDSALMDYRRALALEPGMTLAAMGLGRLQDKGMKVTR